MRIHGNWVGPYWSAGKHQESVDSDYPAVDEFDETAKKHDRAYAKGGDLYKADLNFFASNIKSWDPLRVISGAAVGAQGALRRLGILSRYSSKKMPPLKRPRLYYDNPPSYASLFPTAPRTPYARRIVSRPNLSTYRGPKNRYRLNHGLMQKYRKRRTFRRKRTVRRRRRTKRRFARKSTKTRNIFNKALYRGTVHEEETGIADAGPSGATEAIYVGHGTFIMQRVREQFFKTLIKLLFAKTGIDIPSMTSAPTMHVGDLIRLYYRATNDSGAVLQNIAFAWSTTITFGQIAAYFATQTDTSWNEQTIPVAMTLETATGTGDPVLKDVDLNLTYINVEFAISSKLKVQNITVSATGDEADQVDRIPIKGTQYWGTGTGPESNTGQSVAINSMQINKETGVFTFIADGINVLESPPPKRFFRHVRGSRQRTIGPGDIHLSKLYQHQVISLRKFMEMCYTPANSLSTPRLPYGKFSFLGLEHTIKASQTDPEIYIKGENEWRCAMIIKIKRRNTTNPSNHSNWVTYGDAEE